MVRLRVLTSIAAPIPSPNRTEDGVGSEQSRASVTGSVHGCLFGSALVTTTVSLNMSTSSTGHSASSATHPLVVHVVVGGTGLWPIFLGGLVGGLTVFAGVLLAEWLTRIRERRSRIHEAHFMAIQLSLNFAVEDTRKVTPVQWLNTAVPLQLEVGRIGAQARWPMRNAAAIRSEVLDILHRIDSTSDTMLRRQEKVDPTEVMGRRLGPLLRGEKPPP